MKDDSNNKKRDGGEMELRVLIMVQRECQGECMGNKTRATTHAYRNGWDAVFGSKQNPKYDINWEVA